MELRGVGRIGRTNLGSEKSLLFLIAGATICYLFWVALQMKGFQITGALNMVGWQGVLLGTLAMGALFPSVLGEFDFSAHAVCGVCSIFLSYAAGKLPFAPILCLLLGMGLGAVNALVAAWTHIPPSVVTFVMAQLITTFSTNLLSERTVVLIDKEGLVYRTLNLPWSLKPFGLSASFVLLAVLLLLGQYILRDTYLGRCLVAVGESEKNAERLGVNCRATRLMAFMLSGGFAAAAALLMVGRQGFGQATAGSGFGLYGLVALLLAGSGARRGRGSALSILLCSMFVSAVRQWSMQYCYPIFYSGILPGALFLFSLAVFRVQRSRGAVRGPL